jgi:hypothetical protein
MTITGLAFANLQLVAQCLNHLCYHMSLTIAIPIWKKEINRNLKMIEV